MVDKELTLEGAKQILPKRVANSNKATYGKILNISGSKFYQGAAVLSSLSALKIGAGYVTLACSEEILNNVASYTPDITFIPLKANSDGSIKKSNIKILSEKLNDYSSISIGCGITTHPDSISLIKNLLKKEIKVPVVIDADAINCLAKINDFKLPQNSIITPHPKELSRLLDIKVEEINANREKYALRASKEFGCITLLKGNKTIIATPTGEYYTNPTGNSGLAKAGSGDILTGIITGLLAQRCTPPNAARLGAFIHGICADIAAKTQTEYSILASELITFIPLTLKEILNSDEQK